MLQFFEVIEKTNGKWFSVEFIKKDGTLRKMCCRVGVKKHLQGGLLGYEAKDKGLIVVWDRKAKDYRMINVHTIKKLKIGGQTWLA